MRGIKKHTFGLPNKTMAKLCTIVNKTVGASSPSVLTQQNSNAALPIVKNEQLRFERLTQNCKQISGRVI